MTIREQEQFYLSNDLYEYQLSIEGKALQKALDNEQQYDFSKEVNDYYNARNNGRLTYDNDSDKLKGIESDRYLSDLYKQQN
mgnify:CR=1 FL=1